jgi:sarcosine oxidase subunit gamma
VSTLDPAQFARRSFVYRRLIGHGAVFADMSGGVIAEHFGAAEAEAVSATRLGLADLSPLPRIGFKGRGALAWLSGQGVRGLAEDNRADRQTDGTRAARLAPTEALILSDLAATSRIFERLKTTWRLETASQCYLLPRDDSHYWFHVSGGHAASMFAKLCGVDLRSDRFPAGAIAQTSIARSNAIVIRNDQGSTLGFDLLGDSASADYMWSCLLDAMTEFGGKPVGRAALIGLAGGAGG